MRKILIIISLQLLLIALLGYKIISERNNILKTLSVNPVNKNLISFNNNSSRYKFFYEPLPNTTDFGQNSCGKNKYYLNNDTLNDHKEHITNKDNKTFRLMTLGDSFTTGICVDPDQSWPKQLESILNKTLICTNKVFEVINLGAGGYDLEYSAERYRLRGQKYDPDMIIWFLKDDDFNEEADYLFERIDFYQKRVGKVYENGKFNGTAWTLAAKDMQNYYRKNKDQILKHKQQILDNFLSSFHHNVFIITFPFMNQEYKNLIEEVAIKHRNLFLFDGLTDIYKTNERNYFIDMHPNEKGYKIIANDIFNFLTRKSIISCP